MPETPCTMIQGPLDQELRVVEDHTMSFMMWLSARQTWVGYVRLRMFDDSFGFECEAETQWQVANYMAQRPRFENPKSAGP